MKASDWTIASLTAALVLVTFFYARYTYKMMQSADRTERFNRQPTLGISVIKAERWPMEPHMDPVVMFSINLVNLGVAPLLEIITNAELVVADIRDAKLLYQKPVVPFLMPGASCAVPISFITPFDKLFEVAQTIIDFRLTDDSVDSPFVDFGQNFPICRITTSFRNQAGDTGMCTTAVRLMAVADAENPSFLIMPIESECINCSWTDSSSRDVRLSLKSFLAGGRRSVRASARRKGEDEL